MQLAYHHFFASATKEAELFNSKESLDKISIKKGDIRFSKSRILEGQRFVLAGGLEDSSALRDLDINILTPIVDRYSPLPTLWPTTSMLLSASTLGSRLAADPASISASSSAPSPCCLCQEEEEVRSSRDGSNSRLCLHPHAPFLGVHGRLGGSLHCLCSWEREGNSEDPTPGQQGLDLRFRLPHYEVDKPAGDGGS